MLDEAAREDSPPFEADVRFRPVRTIILLLAVVAALVAMNVLLQPSGWAKVEPGPTLDVSRAANGAGVLERKQSDGHFLLLTVQVTRIPVWQKLLSIFRGGDDLVEVGPKRATNRDAISDSKSAAAVAASRFVAAAATNVRVTGLRVEATVVGSPAARAGLRSGDIITSINGRRIGSAVELKKAAADGSATLFDVSRNGPAVKFSVAPENGQFGVVVTELVEGKFPVSFDTGTIDGGSGGLAMALATIDALTAGDLTGGSVIAVSGMISSDGSVLPVSGLKEKAVAARADGAVVMLAPAGSTVEVGSAIPVVEVSDIAEAISWLCLQGSDDDVCDRP